MTYCTLIDLVARAGEAEILQVADRDMDGIADAPVIDAAIEEAAVQIDTWLAGRCSLPLAPIPAIVKMWAVSLARYALHRDGAPDHVVRDQRDAISGLQAAAAGRLSLPSETTGEEPGPSVAGGIGVSSDPPVFDPRRLRGWL